MAEDVVTLSQAVAAYLEAIEGVRTESVVANHRSVSRRFLEFFPGDRPVQTLRRQDLLAFLDWFTHRRGRFTPHTYNLGLEFLKRLGRFCLARGWLEENPAAEISYQAIERSAPVVLTRQEMARLWEVAQGEELHAIVVGLLGQLGLKKRELLALRFADLELDGPEPVAIVRYSGKLRQKSRRLNLPPTLAEVLRRYRARRQSASSFSYLDPVVPVTGRQVNNIIAKLCREAGVRRVNPQILRDTAAVHLLADGWPPEEVARQLGYTTRGYLLEFLPRFQIWIEPTPEGIERRFMRTGLP